MGLGTHAASIAAFIVVDKEIVVIMRRFFTLLTTSLNQELLS
jgi:hypothetical protein